MGFTLPPVRTLADIKRNIIVETKGQTTYTRIICGPDTGSIEAFGRVTPPDWTWTRASQAKDKWGDSFNLTKSYDEALGLVRNGWPEGLDKIQKMADRFVVKAVSGVKDRLIYRGNVTPGHGSFINVPNVIAGHPNQFVNQRRVTERKNHGGIIRIAYNVSASGGCHSDRLIARGAAVFALIDALERQRKSIEFAVFDAYYGNRDYAMSEWYVKPAGMRWNKASMAFALAHPDCLRRIMFGMLEHHPQAHKYHGHYGGVATVKGNFPKEYNSFDIVVDSQPGYDEHGNMLGAWTDDASVQKWIKGQLSKLGVVAGE